MFEKLEKLSFNSTIKIIGWSHRPGSAVIQFVLKRRNDILLAALSGSKVVG